ncbi:hypothetical protein PENANT_c030G08771 [Penicillium antarcticum]|uniref:Uncharacterized protein n=1 Tax=Penicillium antarcticum TaxID=416450 RepID=A0A1V6PVI1_9EURO|nr:hypothetical protein PENANT_c030G08771 [Penicillium antarcticum]
MENSDKIPPLLMERPRSAGVDAEAFSFAKPASHGKPFSLKKFTKKTPLSQSAVGDSQPLKEHTQGEGSFNGQFLQLEALLRGNPYFSNRGGGYQCPRGNPRKMQLDLEQQFQHMCTDQTSRLSKPSRFLGRMRRFERTDDSLNTCIAEENVRIQCSSLISTVDNANGSIPMLPGSTGPRQKIDQVSNNALSSMPLKVVDNKNCAAERRRTRQEMQPTKRLKPPVVDRDGVLLGEDDLFELLIMKMRKREENEERSANVQQHIEIENSKLKAEIHSLHDRLKSCQAKFVESSSDANFQRAQIDKWKARLHKFKNVINELGLEYDTLREQANDLKSTMSCLQKEKAEIQLALDEIRLQVAKGTDIIEAQRNKLSSFEAKIAMLREALAKSDKQEESMRLQLSHEKERVVTLESYIQNESQSQARCLTIVRKGQSEMIGKLESACKMLATVCSDSQDAVALTIVPVLEQCVSSVQELKERCGVQTMNVEELTCGAHEATTRVDALAGQLTRCVEANINVGNGISRSFQEGLQLIKGTLGPNSSLSKQLANSDNQYAQLQEKLEVVEPMVDGLNASVKAIKATETDLVHCIEIFSQRLADAQMPVGNPVLEMEISNKFAENTQLQLELERVSLGLESLRKQLGKRTSENEHLQHALTEAVTSEQSSKSRNSRLEIEKTALRGELQLVEHRVREELSIANTEAQDRLKTNFEKQIQRLEMSNAKLETEAEQLKTQLSEVQRSLAETEKTAETEQLEKTTMLEESKRQIEELIAACSKYLAEAKTNDIELQGWKSCEAELKLEKERLLGELEQAREKTHVAEASLAEKAKELKASLALKTKSESHALRATQGAEKKLKALELETTQKTEELAKMHDNFEMIKSRFLALEKVGEEADSETVALLRRAQEAESWQATIREGFARIIEMHSDEPFEQTWQKVENILQSSPNQRPITMVSSSTNLSGSASLRPSDNERLCFGPREGLASEALDVDQRTENGRETIANSHSNMPLSQRTYNPSKPLTRDSADWSPKMPIDVGHIVPFASLHDKLSREDSLSLFNDPAELEMLFMSTPDLQGPADLSKTPMSSQGRKEMSENPDTVGQNASVIDSVIGKPVRKADDSKIKGSNAALGKLDGPLVDTNMESEKYHTKRKVVSFEGAGQTETGRSRRMSDAIDNNSGMASEDKVPKRTQKHTYSRLRQSIAQEQTSAEASVQPTDNALAAKPQVPMKTKESDAGPAKPAKRARNSAPGPERRLSPKRLASGSSKANVIATRARTKRTTRSDRYNQRFSQNA